MDYLVRLVDSAVAFDSVLVLKYYLISRWHWLPLQWLVFPPC